MATKKSLQSGSLFGSGGQYVGLPAQIHLTSTSKIGLNSTLPLLLIEQDLQWRYLELKSPSIIHLVPKLYSTLLTECDRGGNR